MGGEDGSELWLRLTGIRTQAVTGLVKPVRLHQRIAGLATFQLAQIFDGARSRLQLALQSGIALVGQPAELFGDLVIDPLLTAGGDGHSVGQQRQWAQQSEQQSGLVHHASLLA